MRGVTSSAARTPCTNSAPAGHWLIAIADALRQVSIAARHAQCDVFAPAHFIDCGNAVGAVGKIFFPKHLAGVLIERANFTVGRGGDEDQAAGRHHGPASGVVRAGIVVALQFESENAAVGNLPLDGPGVEIVSGQV